MQISALWRYPVKSCAGWSVDEARVRPRGFAGDRRWMVVDRAGRHFTQRECGALALVVPELTGDGLAFQGGPSVRFSELEATADVTIWDYPVRALVAPAEVNAWVSERAGADVRLVHMPDGFRRQVNPSFSRQGDVVSFADGYPYLIASEASLAEVNARLEQPVPMRRFRANLVIAGSGAFDEDTWKRIRVGTVEFDVVKPCARCVVVDTDPATGRRAKGVLRALAQFRRWDGEVYFGQNAIARGEGAVRVGDPVVVLDG